MNEELCRESDLRDYCTLASRMLSDMSSLCILLKSSANLCNRNRVESRNHITTNCKMYLSAKPHSQISAQLPVACIEQKAGWDVENEALMVGGQRT